MPRYRVKEKSFINNTLYNSEDEKGGPVFVDFDGVPGSNLEAVEEVSKETAQAAALANAESLARQALAAKGVNVSDPAELEIAKQAAANEAAAALAKKRAADAAALS